jgi:hypothetical protein
MKTITSEQDHQIAPKRSASTDEQQIIRDCEFLRNVYPAESRFKLDIKPLWLGHYRLNYWSTSQIDDGFCKNSLIEKSLFIRVRQTPDGLLHEDLTNEKR